MLPTAIIVLREVLEAALVVGIVMAASRGAPGRGRWVSLGIAGGVLGAAAVAGGAGAISRAVAGIGQELFDAAILFAAVVMLGWHNVWMSRHGRELAASAARLGGAVREGSEVVLFLHGIALSGENAAWAMAAGGAIGLAAGAAAGTAIYWGLVSIPLRYLFTVTSWLVLLLAAGMASQGAAFLMQAGLLPPLGGNLWDTSFLLSDNSILGKVLHTLVVYTAAPAGIQVVFYLVTLAVIGAMMRLVVAAPARPPRPVRAAPAE